MELLRALDQVRITDLTEAPSDLARDAANLGYRIMADRALVTALAQQVGTVLARHGVIMAPGKIYSFVPIVYPRPLFAGQAQTPCAWVPHAWDQAGRIQAPVWVNPLDGIPPPDLLRALAQSRQ